MGAEPPEQSASRDAKRDAELLQELERALNAQDWRRAIDMARDALAGGLVHPLTLNLRALWLEQQGRHEEALNDLVQASNLAPRDVTVLNALGLCLSHLGRLDEAIAAFNKAIEAQADFAPAYLNRGLASETLGDLATARQDFQQAHDFNPQDPEPLSCLAALAARRADWSEAHAFASRVLAVHPRHPGALIARALADLAEGALAQAEAALSDVIANPNVPPLGRARARGLLGDVLDAAGRFDEAFAAYNDANLAMREVHALQFEAPGVETMPHYMRWLTEYFERASAAHWAPGAQVEAALDAPEPLAHVFLVGFPRSGTTLLENVLASHPSVVTMEEQPFLVDAARDLVATPDGLDRLANLGPAQLAECRNAYWRHVRDLSIDATGKVFVDKHPMHSVNLPLIVKLFPRAKVLFACRDPRDTVWSCFRRQFRMNPSTYQFLTLAGAANLYDQVMRLFEIYHAKLPLALRMLRYEDLVDAFEPKMRTICEFIGIEWQDEMRHFAERKKARSIATASSTQVVRGLYREGIGQWRRYANEIAPILPILRPWVDKFGYPPE